MRAMQRASKCASQTISSTRTYKLVYYLEVIRLPFGLCTLDYLLHYLFSNIAHNLINNHCRPVLPR